MAKKRIVDINEIAYGKEPEPNIALGVKLNWYSAASNLDDKKKWAIEYFRNKDRNIVKKLSGIDKQWFATMGSICRIQSLGGTLGLVERQSFDAMVERIVTEQARKPKKAIPKKVNILELEKKLEPLNLVYDQIDDVIDLVTQGVKKYKLPTLADGLSNAWIVETSKYYQEHLAEIETVYLGTDEQLNEGYSNYTKTEIKRLIKLYNDIENLLNQYLVRQKNLKAQSRPVKKTKSKPAAKLVEKLNYMKSDKDSKLLSIDPTKIIGAKKLFVYNTKTRKLVEYVTADESGLSLKGSTLTGFSDKSYSKTIRKPLDFFIGFVGSTAFKQSKQLDMVKLVEGKVTGRINKDCILVNCK